MRKPERVDLHVRLPADLHAKLTECAAENERTLNGEIVRRLRQSVDGYRR